MKSCIIIFLISIFLYASLLAQDKNYKDSIEFDDSLYFQNKTDSTLNEKIKSDSSEINNDILESNFQNKFYTGLKTKMSFQYLASLCAPAFWYSPDEPELGRDYKPYEAIKIPAPYPYKRDSTPIVYYQINEIVIKDNALGRVLDKPMYKRDTSTLVDLSKIEGFSIYYTHYYRFEKGSNSHPHDNEQVKFFVKVKERNDTSSGKKRYNIIFDKVIGYAHGLWWYNNMFEIDKDDTIKIKLPLHILVEEGKHASCPDVNGDGYYNPSYDVNVRTFDAWGVRDVIRTSRLFTSYYQSWMSKIRHSDQIIYPPLPKESPYYNIVRFMKSKYKLQLIPTQEQIERRDEELYDDFKLNYFHNEHEPSKEAKFPWSLFSTSRDGFKEFVNSYAVAYRYNERSYFTFTFPFLATQNYELKVLEGWLVHRLSFYKWPFHGKIPWIDNIQYSLLYTPSASRYLDPYISGGIESAKGIKPAYVFESGIKIRYNTRCPWLEFVGKSILGIRLGIKYSIVKDATINHLSMVFEVGFGPF